MSSNGSANDTFLRVVRNYKEMGSRQNAFNFETPTKRPASQMSNNSETSGDSTTPLPVKRLRTETTIVCGGSPREFRRLRCELLESRNYAKDLQDQLAQMRAMSKEATIMYEKETNRWKSQAERDQKTILALEAKIDGYRQKEAANRTEINEIRSAYAEYKTDTELEKQGLKRELSTVQEDMHEQKVEEDSLVAKLQQSVDEKEMLYKAAVEETEAYKTLVADLQKKLQQQTNLESEIEMKTQALLKAQQQIKKIEFSRESYQEFQEQAKNQQSKLSNYEHLDRECARLRDENYNLKCDVYNKLILEEKVHDLKGRLEKFKEQNKQLSALMIEHTQAELNLEEFRSLARSVCEVTNNSSLPTLLRKMVERLQQQELALMSEKIQLTSDLSTRTHEAKLAKDHVDELRLRNAELEKEMKVIKTQMGRLQRKLLLIAGERDNYRKQLDSYEKDLTICMQPARSSGGVEAVQTNYDRIRNLERTIEEYREMVQKLEHDLRTIEGYSSGETAPIRVEQVARLQAELVKMKNDNSALRERKDRLEIQLEELLVGQDCVADGRIVHPSKNPMSDVLQQRESEKQRLEEEVMQLKRKIKKLEEGLEASKLGDVTIDAKEVIRLKEQLQASESRITKMKEHFKSYMHEIRDVVYMLFGFRMDKSQAQYKLTSMYAEHDEDVLLFQMNTDGVFNLLENQYSASLEELVATHLIQHKSIPLFLSALTLDLFENSTMAKTDAEENESDEQMESPNAVPVEIEDDDDDDDDDDDTADDDDDDTVEEVEEMDNDDENHEENDD